VDDGRVARQFILSDSSARSVTLVGDFNGWGEAPAVLKDPTGTGVWEVTLLLPPGRYTYAFLVNDSVWTIDPRAPSSPVGDYGRTSSVALVTGR
jgi:1,4-alpha-glucan branching enzyme